MIESYEFGRIVIDGKEYTNDVIVFSDHVQAEWWRKEGHTLTIEDLSSVLKAKPEILIIGNGHDGVMKVLPEVFDYCERNGIKLIVEKTTEAVKVFNKQKGNSVVAALHLTC